VASAIDATTAEAIEAFCEESPEVEAAYVCLTERTREGAEPERVLRLSVKLFSPVDTPGDTRAPSLQLVQRLARRHPDLMRRLGYGVSADRAVPAWSAMASRSSAARSSDIRERWPTAPPSFVPRINRR
jgi:hypothetical protein